MLKQKQPPLAKYTSSKNARSMIVAGMTVKNTLYNIDRGFIEARYWDVRKKISNDHHHAI